MNFTQKYLAVAFFIFIFIQHPLDATVKVFVNNSSKTLFVRMYDTKNNIVGATLTPGDIQELFIPGDILDRIIIQDKKHIAKPLSSMTNKTLRKDECMINDNMIFIINKNHAIRMYHGSTSKDDALRKIDEIYTKTGKLPTIELSIHQTKTNQPWIEQTVHYTIKYAQSFLNSIESLFSSK